MMFVYVFIALLFCPKPAFAYIDPGSGSFFLQMIMAAGVGLVFHFRRFFTRLFQWKKTSDRAEKLPENE